MRHDRSTSITLRFLVGLVAFLVAAGPVVVVIALTARIDDTDRGHDEVESVVETMAEESAAVADWYFAAPEAALDVIVAQLATGETASLLAPEVRQLLVDVLTSHQNLDGVFAAHPDGTFVFVAHDDSRDEPGFRIKEIEVSEQGDRVVNHMITDENFRIVDTERDVDDPYDPLVRSWYQLVDSGPSIGWTDPYTFYSSGERGITLAGAARDAAGETDLVVGVDVRLTELGRFLDARRPGENGVAMVVSSAGLVVASSPGDSAAADERFVGPMPVADEIVLFSDPDEATTSAAAHVGATNSFVLVTTAADEDFLGNLRAQLRRDGLVAVAIAGISMGLFLLAAAWIGRYIHRLNGLATTDALTGLPNRAAIRGSIDYEIECGQPVAIMILDLDEFKAVNDTYGHAVGDRLLVEVADRLQRVAGDEALVARLGGDEFIVMAQSVTACLDHGLWTAMIDTVADPFVIDGIELSVSASGGVTYAVDPAGTSAVLHEADIALYEAKGRGGADYVIFDGRTEGFGTRQVVLPELALASEGTDVIVTDVVDTRDHDRRDNGAETHDLRDDRVHADSAQRGADRSVAPATLAESLRPFSPTEVP